MRIPWHGLCASFVLLAGCFGQKGPADQQKFYGKWALDKAKSHFAHPQEADMAVRWRSYSKDGEGVKVSWSGNEGGVNSYSAKCDGTVERAAQGDVRCWQVDTRTIDGEQLSKADPKHRYYRRAVSPDGKYLTLTWYDDAKHTKETDRLVFAKE